jgi:putative membrane protein
VSDPTDGSWRRLHLLSPVVNLIPQIWFVLRQAWPLIVVWVVGGRAQGRAYADVALLGVLLVLSVGSAVVHALTLRFRVIDGFVEIQSGLIGTQVRRLDPSHVQNVEVTRSLLQRLFGLAELRLETASDAGAEGELSALRVADAEALATWVRERRAASASTAVAVNAVDAPPWLALSLTEVMVGGVVRLQLGFLLVGFGVLSEYFLNLDPTEAQQVGVKLGADVWLAAAVGALLLGWLFDIGRSVLTHGGFVMRVAGGLLSFSGGLLTRRRVELPIARIQLLTIAATWPERRLGHARVSVECASVRVGGEGSGRNVAEIPWLPAEREEELLQLTFPRLEVPLVEARWVAAHPRAMPRVIVRRVIAALLLTLLARVLLGAAGWWMILSLPALVATGVYGFRRSAWRLEPRHLVVRGGAWRQWLEIADRDRVQAVSMAQGPMLRRLGLAVVHAYVAGSSVTLPPMSSDDALMLVSRLSARVARRPRPPSDGESTLTSGWVVNGGEAAGAAPRVSLGGSGVHHEQVGEHVQRTEAEEDDQRPRRGGEDERGDQEREQAAGPPPEGPGPDADEVSDTEEDHEHRGAEP